MTLNDVEKQELQHCIEFRIGTGIIRQLENLFTTQKCEAVNRAISTSVPKMSHIAETTVHVSTLQLNELTVAAKRRPCINKRNTSVLHFHMEPKSAGACTK